MGRDGATSMIEPQTSQIIAHFADLVAQLVRDNEA
jgi:hypothetical protein